MIFSSGSSMQAYIRQEVVPSESGTGIRTRSVVHDLGRERALERALRSAEQRFQRFFEEAPVGIALIDHNGRLEECNTAFRSMGIEALGELVDLERHRLQRVRPDGAAQPGRDFLEPAVEAEEPQAQHLPAGLLAVERQAVLADIVPHLGQQPRGRRHRGGHLRIDRPVHQRLRRPGDSQARRRLADERAVGLRRPRDDEGIARLRNGQAVQHRRHVAHGPGLHEVHERRRCRRLLRPADEADSDAAVGEGRRNPHRYRNFHLSGTTAEWPNDA